MVIVLPPALSVGAAALVAWAGPEVALLLAVSMAAVARAVMVVVAGPELTARLESTTLVGRAVRAGLAAVRVLGVLRAVASGLRVWRVTRVSAVRVVPVVPVVPAVRVVWVWMVSLAAARSVVAGSPGVPVGPGVPAVALGSGVPMVPAGGAASAAPAAKVVSGGRPAGRQQVPAWVVRVVQAVPAVVGVRPAVAQSAGSPVTAVKAAPAVTAVSVGLPPVPSGLLVTEVPAAKGAPEVPVESPVLRTAWQAAAGAAELVVPPVVGAPRLVSAARPGTAVPAGSEERVVWVEPPLHPLV
jgi:hypothetical protein